MATLRVQAPVDGFHGDVAGIQFADGVATFDPVAHPGAYQYFQDAGYAIDGVVRNARAAASAPARGPYIVRVGTPAQDAAVDPSPDDFLAPTNAGEADPHGPLVVAPGIHGVGPKPIRGGEVFVDNPEKQDAAETELAERVLVDQEPVGQATAAVVPQRPAVRAPVADWRDWAVVQGADPLDAAGKSKEALIAEFGG